MSSRYNPSSINRWAVDTIDQVLTDEQSIQSIKYLQMSSWYNRSSIYRWAVDTIDKVFTDEQ